MPIATHTPRILVVDDNPHNIRMVKSMLAAETYEVIEAGDGMAGLECVAQQSPDLIITDIIMPRLDGFAFVQALREDPKSRAIPVLMITSLHELNIKLKGLQAGADDFLSKPFISVELLARVRSLLRIKQMHDDLQAKNRILERVLTRYISKDIATQILSDPEQNLRLGGESAEVSVLFADIRGFTHFSELHNPAEVTSMLNQIFSNLTVPIFEYDGTLDKYLGDAVMAFYGAPVPSTDYAERALRTAWAMQQCFTRLWDENPYLRELGVGIGICTGEAIVGNVGSERLMDYTVIGQTVNMAKRLQEHARAGQILIDAQTHAAAAAVAEVRAVTLPGLQEYRQLTSIYEVVAVNSSR